MSRFRSDPSTRSSATSMFSLPGAKLALRFKISWKRSRCGPRTRGAHGRLTDRTLPQLSRGIGAGGLAHVQNSDAEGVRYACSRGTPCATRGRRGGRARSAPLFHISPQVSACNQRFDLWTKMPASYDDAKKAGPRPEKSSKPGEGEDDGNSTLERRIDHLNDAVRAFECPRPRTLLLSLRPLMSRKDSTGWRCDGRLA